MPEAIHPEHLFPVANPNSAYDAHRILMLGHQPSYNQQHQQQQKVRYNNNTVLPYLYILNKNIAHGIQYASDILSLWNLKIIH